MSAININYASAQMLIRKPVHEVFEAFIDPAITQHFWFTKGSEHLEIDKTITWEWEMYQFSLQVIVREIIPLEKISIEWFTPEVASTVDFSFQPLGDAATFVSIKNYGFTQSGDDLIAAIKDSTEGFAIVLAGLKAYLEHGIKLNLIADKYPKDSCNQLIVKRNTDRNLMAKLSTLQVIKGDITKVQAAAIVNAANTSLLGGGGVDGAIHRAGGPAILEDCRKIIARQGGCATGEAVITTAGNLPATYVIHTVGPVWNGGQKGEREQLANCYKNALQLAIDHQCKPIAFPNISTGIYRFPKAEAAAIAVSTVAAFLKNKKEMEQVVFVCFDDENFELIEKAIKELV